MKFPFVNGKAESKQKSSELKKSLRFEGGINNSNNNNQTALNETIQRTRKHA